MSIDMAFLAGFLKKEAGIILPGDKTYLVESRLSSVAARHGKESVGGLVEGLKTFASLKMRQDVIEALTTNETSFFRDSRPFETFKTIILPRMIRAQARTRLLRLWCAAASTGQEPYSLAMLLMEERARLAGWKVEILATDLDTAVLAKAREGVYTKFEVQRGLPATHLVRYFTQWDADRWQIRSEIRDMVTFRPLNLLDGQAGYGHFDVVFCRNVLIYFDLSTKADVLGKISRQMHDHSVLFLGGAETVMGVTDAFVLDPDLRGVYLKRGLLRAAA